MERRRIGYLIFFMSSFFLLSGCTYHVTKQIAERLDPDVLYKEYKITPADLSKGSKCAAPPAVKIVNSETRNGDYLVLKNPPRTLFINPREMMDGVSTYLKKGYERIGIRIDDRSTKVLQIKMVNLQSIVGGWSFEGRFKMELTIPEIKYLKTYEGMDNAAEGLNAPAYAIHAVVRDVINDADVQNYILCR